MEQTDRDYFDTMFNLIRGDIDDIKKEQDCLDDRLRKVEIGLARMKGGMSARASMFVVTISIVNILIAISVLGVRIWS